MLVYKDVASIHVVDDQSNGNQIDVVDGSDDPIAFNL